MNEYLLSEFEAWCKGAGRGNQSGVHYTSLEAAARFRMFKQQQESKLDAMEKKAKLTDSA